MEYLLKIESLQYNAALSITGANIGSSKEKLYQELGFESLKDRKWMRKLCYFFKAISFTRSSYLYDLLPPLQRFHRNKSCYQRLYCRTEIFKNSILPYTRHSLNNLDPKIRRTHSYVNFRKKLLSFVRPTENKTFSMYNLFSGIRLFNRLRSDYSPLNEHAFRHGFGNTFNPFVSNAPFFYP